MTKAEINPSEDERERIIAILNKALSNANGRVRDIESSLKKKQKLEDNEISELEKEMVHVKHHVTALEEAINKSERTSGHTLKKAFSKKFMNSLKDDIPAADFTELEAIFEKHGLSHHHPDHHHLHKTHSREKAEAH